MLRRLAAAVPIALALFAAAAGAQAATAAARLERVVVVVRHGVRPPTVGNDRLDKLSAQPWPNWPVAPGELTPHGAEVVRLVGESLRKAYVRAGLLPAGGCPAEGAVEVWADGADQRTRRSGEVLAAAMAPGCGVSTRWGEPGARDPLFSGAPAPACPIDGAAAEQAVRAELKGDPIETPASIRALARLQAIVAPQGCRGGPGVCLSGEDALAPAKGGVRLTGPLDEGASLAEDLLLEYAEGLPAKDVGWGQADGRTIAEVMPAHERASALTRQTPYLAVRRGGELADLVARAFTAPPGPPQAAGPRLGAKLTVIAGHDTNLSNLAGVFGLDWRLPGQPDMTAPATALAFQLWREPDGREAVRAVVAYLPLEAMRELAPNAVRSVAVPLGACAGRGACTPAKLRALVDAQVPAGCRPA